MKTEMYKSFNSKSIKVNNFFKNGVMRLMNFANFYKVVSNHA